MFLNKVQVIGNLTRAPELKSLPSGDYVASCSVAVNRTYKDKSGKKVEQVEFVNLTAFGKTAENLAKYAIKGQNMYFEGRLQTRSWDDKESGKKQYRTEVVVEKFEFGAKPQGTARTERAEQHDPNNGLGEQQWDAPAASTSGGIEYPKEDIDPNDIPF